MKKVLITLSLILGIFNFCFAGSGKQNIEKQKIIQAIKKMYGGRIPIVDVEKAYSPIKKRNYEIIVYKFKIKINNQERSFPITAIKLDGKLYLIPAFVDVNANKNLAMLWGFKVQDGIKLNLSDKNLIYGEKRKCKHSMTIFSDPECPFCRRFVPMFLDKGIKYNMCIYYIDFPLSFHKHAKTYVKYLITLLDHAKLKDKINIIKEFYSNTDNPDKAKKYALAEAKKLGLSEENFYKYMATKVDNILNNEIELAKKANISGTPTVLIDFKRINNSQIDEILKSLE